MLLNLKKAFFHLFSLLLEENCLQVFSLSICECLRVFTADWPLHRLHTHNHHFRKCSFGTRSSFDNWEAFSEGFHTRRPNDWVHVVISIGQRKAQMYLHQKYLTYCRPLFGLVSYITFMWWETKNQNIFWICHKSLSLSSHRADQLPSTPHRLLLHHHHHIESIKNKPN